MTDLYPFQGRYFERNGLRLHYLDEGSGDPVVMLHGNPTWSFYYRNLVLGLRDAYRTIVPDHIGCGLSDKPDDTQYNYRLAERVSDLEALLDHLGVTKDLTLVLHDWGGMIGMAYATRYPDRIRRLLILNTAAFHLPKGKRLPWSLRLCRSKFLGPLLVRGLNAFCRGALNYCAVQPLSEAVRAAYLAPYDSWPNRIAVLRFVQDIPLQPGDASYAVVSQVEQRLPTLQDVPMLICWGERDFVFDGEFLNAWKERFPHANVHTFAGAGHFVLEDASSDLIPLVRSFLLAHPI